MPLHPHIPHGETPVDLLTVTLDRLAVWNHPNLAAPYWRLYWNPDHGGWVEYAGRRTPVGPDAFVLIPPDTPFASRLSRPVRHMYIHFLATDPYTGAAPGVHVCPGTESAFAAARTLARQLEAGEEMDGAMRVTATLLVCQGLLQLPPEATAAPAIDPRIRAAADTLEADVASHPSNGELARAAGMNVNAFIRLFRTETGMAPQAWLQRKRIERACLLLHFTRASIEEIAAAVGYCDRYYFSRVFKKLRGVGPAAFRKAARR